MTLRELGNDGNDEAENKARLEEAHKLLWGANAGPGGDMVAAVDPADLREFWKLGRDVKASLPEPEVQYSISVETFKNICSPKADAHAVWYRLSMLQLLCWPMGLLSTRLHDGELDDAVIKIAATIPMKRMVRGTAPEEMPFDVQEFMKQVEQTAAE